MTRVGLDAGRLTRTAADLADRDGLDHVTLSALARHFDVRLPSLYAHVAGAADLHARVTLLALNELTERCERALVGLRGWAALVALAEAHRGYAGEHPGRYEAAGRLRLPDNPEVAQRAAEVAARVRTLHETLLEGYDLSADDEVHAVRLLGSVLRGFLELEAAGGFDHSEPSSQASWQRALEGLDAVLRSWSA